MPANKSNPTPEDQVIWLCLMRSAKGSGEAIQMYTFASMSEAERSAWHDYQTCLQIETLKAKARAELLKARVLGYNGRMTVKTEV